MYSITGGRFRAPLFLSPLRHSNDASRRIEGDGVFAGLNHNVVTVVAPPEFVRNHAANAIGNLEGNLAIGPVSGFLVGEGHLQGIGAVFARNHLVRFVGLGSISSPAAVAAGADDVVPDL